MSTAMQRLWQRYESQIDRLTAENERLGRDYQTARDAHDNLLLENERLRAALEKMEKMLTGDHSTPVIAVSLPMMRSIARAALNEAPQEKSLNEEPRT